MSTDATVWTAEWRGGFRTEICGRGHRLRADEPLSVGGDDSGPMPTELLTAGLASCFCMAVAFAASKRGIEIHDLAVDVTAQRAGKELRYGHYEVAVRSELADAVLERLVEAAKRYCWVTNTLAEPPRVTYEVHGGD
ncbi:MAG: OsmC family protein [Thermoleophilia bacterium]|nr:OsmC family protein [Thermoleophilia bacterium]MDH3724790.1 OsmC family protein [Thermoleophilia bacterium]